ncbi:MAG TPA: hypothetical protein VIU61_07160 [Kofleriaceae bacterium]
MGDETEDKLRKADEKAKKKKKSSMAASTDLADVVKYSPEDEDKFAEKARKERGKSLPKDVPGRIVGMSVEGERTRLMISGRFKGMTGIEGYIKSGSDMLARFRISLQDDTLATAYVDLEPDLLREHLTDVVINPTSMPKSSERRKDIATRVIADSVVGGRTRILIGVGTIHGVRDGMKGHLLDNGKPYVRFVLTKVSSRTSEAFVDTTIDDVRNHKSIMLNPS